MPTRRRSVDGSGMIDGFTRASETKLQVVETRCTWQRSVAGTAERSATVSMTFERWSKLTMGWPGAQQTKC